MNAHKSLGLLAAVLVTAGQTLVFAMDTAAVAQDTVSRGGYENTRGAEAAPESRFGYVESHGTVRS